MNGGKSIDWAFDSIALSILILIIYFTIELVILKSGSFNFKKKAFRNGFLIFGVSYPLIVLLLTFTMEDNFFPRSLTNVFTSILILLFSILSNYLYIRIPIYIKKEIDKKISDKANSAKLDDNFNNFQTLLPEFFLLPAWTRLSNNEFEKNVKIDFIERSILANLLTRSSNVFTESFHILNNKRNSNPSKIEDSNLSLTRNEINKIYGYSLAVYSESHEVFTEELSKFVKLLKLTKESLDLPYFITKQFNESISKNNYQSCLNTTEIKTIKEFYAFARTADPNVYFPPNSRRIFIYDLHYERDLFNKEYRDPNLIDEKCTGNGNLFKKGYKIPYLFWFLELCYDKRIQLRFVERSEAKLIADDLNFKDRSILDFTVKSNFASRLVIGVAGPSSDNYLKIEKIKTLFNITDKNNEYCKFCKRIFQGEKLEDILSLFKINLTNHLLFFKDNNSMIELREFLNQSITCSK